MKNLEAKDIIDFFNMEPLSDEGGFFVETYRSPEKFISSALDPRYGSCRSHSTSILYLITENSFSRIHKVKSDEIFHFYMGDPVEMLQLIPNGSGKKIILGHDFLSGQKLQLTVPRDVWQGTSLLPCGKWALLGCTVAPGFEYDDYISADRDELIRNYPDYTDEICLLT